MTPFSSSFFEMASSSSSSVEMVDLTQDWTVNTKEKALLASGGLQGAEEEEEGLVSLPASSFEATQERGVVISAAARKMILQMALGHSVSTSIVKDRHKSIFQCISGELSKMQNRCKNILIYKLECLSSY